MVLLPNESDKARKIEGTQECLQRDDYNDWLWNLIQGGMEDDLSGMSNSEKSN